MSKYIYIMKERIDELIKSSMKEKNHIKTNLYRGLKSAIFISEKSNNPTTPESILKKELKKRLDSYDIYTKAGRDELANVEIMEADLIQKLLPKEPTSEEIVNVINEYLSNNSPNMGLVMKHIKEKLPFADGKKASKLVKDVFDQI